MPALELSVAIVPKRKQKRIYKKESPDRDAKRYYKGVFGMPESRIR
jgi:hypothetical protein